MTEHKTVREAWEIVKGVVKSLEHQAEWTKEEIHNNEPVAEAFNTLESVINCNASNDVTDLLDYYDVICRQASGVDVERDRKIRFAIAALDRIEAVEKSADLWICHRGVSEPKHDGDTGYEYFEPVRPYKEAVETVTVEDIAMCIQDWKFNEENQQPFFGDYLAVKFPNGLRIVKEK